MISIVQETRQQLSSDHSLISGNILTVLAGAFVIDVTVVVGALNDAQELAADTVASGRPETHDGVDGAGVAAASRFTFGPAKVYLIASHQTYCSVRQDLAENVPSNTKS